MNIIYCIIINLDSDRQKYSTNHAIITLVEKINKALYTGNIMIGVYLDLKKAFDTVNHKILLQKLNTYGIHGNGNGLRATYLIGNNMHISIKQNQRQYSLDAEFHRASY